MGTKNNPGDFDCHAKAAPDEPLFTLRAKDPVAPYLVIMWKQSRMGDWEGMAQTLALIVDDRDVQDRVSTDEHVKLSEALSCASAMREWREINVKD